MKTVLVASSKGGVGKTTLATHLAAQAALAGEATVLIDADPQQSSTRWAERRAGLDSAVLPIDGSARHKKVLAAIPEGTTRVVIDAAAGAMADDLDAYLEQADAVAEAYAEAGVPVQRRDDLGEWTTLVVEKPAEG